MLTMARRDVTQRERGRFRRSAVALLAALALVAAPLRAVMACTMPEVAVVGGAAEGHAHHDLEAEESRRGPATPVDERGHDVCPDLAGCAAVAIAAQAMAPPTGVLPDAAIDAASYTGWDTPLRALEPPPPRR